MINQYFEKIGVLMNKVIKEEKQAIKRAASEIEATIKRDNIIHVFGSGHSHILAEELYYRAGGLASIKPVFIEDLMLHKSALKSTKLERMHNYIHENANLFDITRGDVVIVISNSGKNPVPIEAAKLSKSLGAFVIGLTSKGYKEKQKSRHKDNVFLSSVVDMTINNHVPIGDAIMHNNELDIKFAPVSTIIGATILNGLIAEVINSLISQEYVPPVFTSENSDGIQNNNSNLILKYKERIHF